MINIFLNTNAKGIFHPGPFYLVLFTQNKISVAFVLSNLFYWNTTFEPLPECGDHERFRMASSHEKS